MYDITVPDDDVNKIKVDNPLKHWGFEDVDTPWATTWWNTEYITNIPQEGVNFLLAQGWVITGVTYDTTRTPPIPYYSLTKQVFNNLVVLQSLLNHYTVAYNDARWANTGRYADVIDNWTALIDNTEDYHDDQAADQNAFTTTYLANLNTYMTEVDGLIDTNVTTVESETPFLLDGLGATEVARINEQFAASLSTQLQDLIDRGLYSSVVAADITQRNTRDRDEQLQKLYDQLNREKVDNSYRLAEQRNQRISQKLSEFGVQLDTQYRIHGDNMKLMQYWLSERNQLLVGLYGFVERREDIGPTFGEFAQIAAGLGDSGSGWVTP
jgi:hypothetical protein